MRPDRYELLVKAAAEVTQRLEDSTRELKKVCAERTDLQKLAEAQAFAISLAEEGAIDTSQIQETVQRVMKFGLELYKEAAEFAMGGGDSFGEVIDENSVEKVAAHPTYNGEPVNPVEAVLLEFREQVYGIPSPFNS